MSKLVIDVFGGDNAPGAILEGCQQALADLPDLELLLAGPEKEIRAALRAPLDARCMILDAPEVITNHESPTLAVRKKTKSSIVLGMEAVKRGEAQGFVSAGSTGAVLAGGVFRLGRIPGIQRPALAPLMPTAKGKPVLLIDCGANVDCKPEYLVDFAIMGSAYMERVVRVKTPNVALVNIGAEAEKGNELIKAVYGLLEKAPLHFTGNIEPRDLLAGDADVLVTDGFSGNIILKYTEGLADTLMSMLKEELNAGARSKLGAALAMPALRRFKKKMDASEYGGAPLLGVGGAVVKAHGNSNARAFRCAIVQADNMVRGDVVGKIREALGSRGER